MGVEPIEILIPSPPSVNALFANIRGVGRVKTKSYRAWLTEAGWELLAQRPKKIIGPYRMKLFFGPMRKGSDVGNREKGVSDLLVKQGVIQDDSLARSILAEWDNDVKRNWVKVVLEPI